MEQLFKMWKIYNMASSEEDNTLKFYLYSKHRKGGIVCFELSIDKGAHSLTLNTKCADEHLGARYSNYIE